MPLTGAVWIYWDELTGLSCFGLKVLNPVRTTANSDETQNPWEQGQNCHLQRLKKAGTAAVSCSCSIFIHCVPFFKAIYKSCSSMETAQSWCQIGGTQMMSSVFYNSYNAINLKKINTFQSWVHLWFWWNIIIFLKCHIRLWYKT